MERRCGKWEALTGRKTEKSIFGNLFDIFQLFLIWNHKPSLRRDSEREHHQILFSLSLKMRIYKGPVEMSSPVHQRTLGSTSRSCSYAADAI